MSEKVFKEVAHFPSSSSSKVYVVKQDQDGNLSCDCPAWRFKKPNQERGCKHTASVMAGQPGVSSPIEGEEPVAAGDSEEVVLGLLAAIEKAKEGEK